MGQEGWGSSPGQRFGATRVMVAEAGAVVGRPPRGGEGEVWLPARCFSVGQKLLGDPKLPQMVRATRARVVARDLLVAPGSPYAPWECWRYEAWQK